MGESPLEEGSVDDAAGPSGHVLPFYPASIAKEAGKKAFVVDAGGFFSKETESEVPCITQKNTNFGV